MKFIRIALFLSSKSNYNTVLLPSRGATKGERGGQNQNKKQMVRRRGWGSQQLLCSFLASNEPRLSMYSSFVWINDNKERNRVKLTNQESVKAAAQQKKNEGKEIVIVCLS